MAHVAVVLSGCGVFDGSEVQEAVGVLFHLSRLGAESECFAPDRDQAEVVNHARGKPQTGERRNALVEAARIARGKVRPLAQLRAADFDAVFFPGGFGAAKNLCNFATAGAACEVDAEVARVVQEFTRAGKPIGMCCIAPVIAARVLGTKSGGPGVGVTIGNDPATAAAVRAMGATHVDKPVTGAYVDKQRRVVTTPAYMYGDAAVHEVIEGIGEMVEQTLALTIGAGAVTR